MFVLLTKLIQLEETMCTMELETLCTMELGTLCTMEMETIHYGTGNSMHYGTENSMHYNKRTQKSSLKSYGLIIKPNFSWLLIYCLRITDNK